MHWLPIALCILMPVAISDSSAFRGSFPHAERRVLMTLSAHRPAFKTVDTKTHFSRESLGHQNIVDINRSHHVKVRMIYREGHIPRSLDYQVFNGKMFMYARQSSTALLLQFYQFFQLLHFSINFPITSSINAIYSQMLCKFRH